MCRKSQTNNDVKYLSLCRSDDFVDVDLDALLGVRVVAVLVVADQVEVVVGLLAVVVRNLLVQELVQLKLKYK